MFACPHRQHAPKAEAVAGGPSTHMHAAQAPTYSLSIVSHGQAALVRQLLDDLERLEAADFEVVLTINLPEDESGLLPRPYPVKLIRNERVQGFGANHNAAFAKATGRYFGVVNPDVRAPELRLDRLSELLTLEGVGACAPLVTDGKGHVEDSARRFPTFARLLRRVLLRQRVSDYAVGTDVVDVDWVAGMFMLFRREAYEQAGGFDAHRFFMYYEDVDLCRRLWQLGWSVKLQPATRVIHNAQRASHRNLRHLRWHATSALRYLVGW